MKLTIIFDSQDLIDLSYSLVFIPNPVWLKGEHKLIEVTSDESINLKELIKKEHILEKINSKNCMIIYHLIGPINENYIEIIKAEFEDQEFVLREVYFDLEAEIKKSYTEERTLWEKIITETKKHSITAAALLVKGKFQSIDYENNILTVSFENSAYIEMIKAAKYSKIEEVLQKLFGVKFRLEMVESKVI